MIIAMSSQNLARLCMASLLSAGSVTEAANSSNISFLQKQAKSKYWVLSRIYLVKIRSQISDGCSTVDRWYPGGAKSTFKRRQVPRLTVGVNWEP